MAGYCVSFCIIYYLKLLNCLFISITICKNHHCFFSDLIRRFEKAVQIRLSQPQVTKEIEAKETLKDEALKSSSTNIENTTNIENEKEKEKLDKPEEKISQTGLTVGSEVKEITIEGFLQGLKLKKDLHFGKISEQSWKSNKPIISKVTILFISLLF